MECVVDLGRGERSQSYSQLTNKRRVIDLGEFSEKAYWLLYYWEYEVVTAMWGKRRCVCDLALFILLLLFF